VEQARNADHDAFAALIVPQIERLRGLAGLIVRDSTRAEDAVQEALLKAWRDLPRLRDVDRLDAWLRRLLVNACHDVGRQLKRRRGETPLAPHHEPAGRDEYNLLHDRDELGRGFHRLREEERAVIALRYYLDLPTADAAAALKMRETTYRSRLHRALKTLNAALAAESRTAIRVTPSTVTCSTG
jgi:RNA polymerase sigma-70 factor (ECF subfamily)